MRRFDAGLFFIPRLAAALIRALHLTMRVRHVNAGPMLALNAAGKGYVFAFWHGHILMMVYAMFAKPIQVMISRHRDGELIARAMQRFGAEPFRGSTSKGGASALKQMIRKGRENLVLGITPDGPRGPRRIAQEGVVLAAQLSRIPIVPCAFVSKKKSF